MNTPNPIEPPQKKNTDWWYYAFGMRILADFGVTIAVPAVLAGFLGDWLDERWGTKPVMIILLCLVAFIFTAILIVRKAYTYADLFKKGPQH
ncbi:MAG: AtpZ/AtpI family protein [Patescibacteria group bacterium]